MHVQVHRNKSDLSPNPLIQNSSPTTLIRDSETNSSMRILRMPAHTSALQSALLRYGDLIKLARYQNVPLLDTRRCHHQLQVCGGVGGLLAWNRRQASKQHAASPLRQFIGFSCVFALRWLRQAGLAVCQTATVKSSVSLTESDNIAGKKYLNSKYWHWQRRGEKVILTCQQLLSGDIIISVAW